MVLGVSKRLGVRPVLGIRAKLSTQHGGHWGSTSGRSVGKQKQQRTPQAGYIGAHYTTLQALTFTESARVTVLR